MQCMLRCSANPRECDEFSTSQLLPVVLEVFGEPEYTDARDKYREASPLWWAVHVGNVRAVEILLAHPGVRVMAPHWIVAMPHRYAQDTLEWFQSLSPNALFNNAGMERRLKNILNLLQLRAETEKSNEEEVTGKMAALGL